MYALIGAFRPSIPPLKLSQVLDLPSRHTLGSGQKKKKVSSFNPHISGRHVYGCTRSLLHTLASWELQSSLCASDVSTQLLGIGCHFRIPDKAEMT